MSCLSTAFGRRLAVLLALVLFVALTPLRAVAVPLQRLAYPDGAGATTELWGFTHPSPVANDYYGRSTAVSGRWAVVGTLTHAIGATTNAGLAAAYKWSPADGWQYVEDLPIHDPAIGDWVGRSVAVSANQLFVGAPGKQANGPTNMTGLVYVYDATDSGVTLEQTVSVDATGSAGEFGRAMAVDGDLMAVSAPVASVGTTPAGAVFVFEKGTTGWVQTRRIDPSDPEAFAGFGNSLALQGDDLAIGAPNGGPDTQGRVYTSHRSATGVWGPLQTLSLPVQGSTDAFGTSVAVSNGILVATAPGRDTSASASAGMAYVFRWTGTAWAAVVGLESPASPWGIEQFGQRVALSADTLLISSRYGPGADGSGMTGAVYRYTVDPNPLLPPTFAGRMNASSPGASPSPEFGNDLAFDGDTMLTGGQNYSTGIMPRVGAGWFFGGVRTARCRVDRTLSVPMPGLLGNDYSNAGTMTASVLSAPAHGIATVNSSGAWTYDPTSWFIGTDTFRYRMSDPSGSSDSTVTVQVYAPATKTATSISITSNLYSVRLPRTFNLTGVLKPGAYLDPCVVYVKKPGSFRWSYSSARLAYSITPNVGANWWYRYAPKLRGTYAFKAYYGGDANRLASWSGIIYVRVR
jgi:hypothetical protein